MTQRMRKCFFILILAGSVVHSFSQTNINLKKTGFYQLCDRMVVENIELKKNGKYKWYSNGCYGIRHATGSWESRGDTIFILSGDYKKFNDGGDRFLFQAYKLFSFDAE